VKLWLDAQLPPGVAGWVASRFGVECEHIRGTGLAAAIDQDIFQTLREPGMVLVTKDEDLVDLVTRLGPPPHIVWVRRGNFSNRGLREHFETVLGEALELVRGGEALVELVDRA
jgi:predicted nuclease of predicted toxin-antitoxin system